MPSEGDRAAMGLRERKKIKTHAAIQREALRLFREQGYGATTVEQIAEAAEVSPSTFFRYFPTKEDVVLYDVLDPVMIATFKAQPADLSPIQALRAAFRDVYDCLSAEELTQQRERAALFLSVPELRGAWMNELAGMIQLLAGLIAERSGRRADDLGVRNYAGAVIGAIMAAWLATADDPSADVFELVDGGMARLENGLSL